MAVSKTEKFDVQSIEVAEFARALSHPARVAILSVLASRNECICGDLVDELPLAQATVSQHLKILKEAGLISGTVSGPRTCYCINRETLARASTLLGDWFEHTHRSVSCC